MEKGEFWVYATSDTPWWTQLVRVQKVVRNRVYVETFDDDGMPTGYSRWTLAHHLRARPEDAFDYFQQAKLRKAEADAEQNAADFVFDQVVPMEVATLGYRDDLFLRDADTLAEISELPVEQLTDPNVDIYRIARALAEKYSDQIARALLDDEREEFYRELQVEEDRAQYWPYMTTEEVRERVVVDAGRLTKHRNAVIRAWLGQPVLDTLRENVLLRLELARVRVQARAVLKALRYETTAKRTMARVEQLEAIFDVEPSPQRVRRSTTNDPT